MKRRKATAFAVLLWLSSLIPAPLSAEPVLGSVTRQPLPRWVSMKADEANARRGPSMNHRVDWVFKHRNMPLLVTAEYGHWRRVEDQEGAGGWIHYILLSRTRTVMVDPQKVADPGVDLRRTPQESAELVARAEPGAIAFLKECDAGWCQIASGSIRGWVAQDLLWGVDLPGTD